MVISPFRVCVCVGDGVCVGKSGPAYFETFIEGSSNAQNLVSQPNGCFHFQTAGRVPAGFSESTVDHTPMKKSHFLVELDQQR
jgi:hypothetical protein